MAAAPETHISKAAPSLFTLPLLFSSLSSSLSNGDPERPLRRKVQYRIDIVGGSRVVSLCVGWWLFFVFCVFDKNVLVAPSAEEQRQTNARSVVVGSVVGVGGGEGDDGQWARGTGDGARDVTEFENEAMDRRRIDRMLSGVEME